MANLRNDKQVCPQCGGGLHYLIEVDKDICDNCGRLWELADLEPTADQKE